MLDWFYEKLLTRLVTWLTGIGADGFSKVVEWVQSAEVAFNDGASRAEWVKKQIATFLKISTPFIMNLLTEMAVAYAKKQGWIK